MKYILPVSCQGKLIYLTKESRLTSIPRFDEGILISVERLMIKNILYNDDTNEVSVLFRTVEREDITSLKELGFEEERHD